MFHNIFLEIYTISGFGCSWNCMLLRLNLLTYRAKFPFWWKYSKPYHCLQVFLFQGIFLWLQRTIARTRADSSLYLINDFVKKIYFFSNYLCGKISTHWRAAGIVQRTLRYSSSIFTCCCHFATFTLPLHTHILFFWGTIWELVTVCHFNTSAYVPWEQVFFFFLLKYNYMRNKFNT